MSEINQEWLTCKDAAKALGTTKSTISRMIASGKLEAVRIGNRSYRIRPEALRAYIAMNTTSVVNTVTIKEGHE